mgnify:CR=1 FL=1
MIAGGQSGTQKVSMGADGRMQNAGFLDYRVPVASDLPKLNAEIAKILDMPAERVRKILKITREPISLETPVGDEEESEFGQFIADEKAISPEAAADETGGETYVASDATKLQESFHDVLDKLEKTRFEASIPEFTLSVPRTLH